MWETSRRPSWRTKEYYTVGGLTLSSATKDAK